MLFPFESRQCEGGKRLAFTLVELLVAIAIIGILAALLLPALSLGPYKSKKIACINDLKQLALAAAMYNADNEGRLAENYPQLQSLPTVITNSWIMGNMRYYPDATNLNFVRTSKFFPYANNVGIYHCPADSWTTNGRARTRSYSMNSWVGGRSMEQDNYGRFRTFARENELSMAGPARIWVIGDEDDSTLDDGYFLVTMNDSRPFASLPGLRHGRSYCLNFADGHAESIKLRDPTTFPGARFNDRNLDWLRLKEITTVK